MLCSCKSASLLCTGPCVCMQSIGNGEPQILLNFEDDLADTFHEVNAPFQVLNHLRDGT